MSTSQINQDTFVLETLNHKRNGTFVDIGCSTPKYISNTYMLENQYGWRGIGIDIERINEPNTGETWEQLRPNTVLITQDALTIDYQKIFEQNNLPATIDYLSLDLEPPELTLQCLFKIPFNAYKFRVITFETDEYRINGESRRDQSRQFLIDIGYRFVKNVNKQDDFYVISSQYLGGIPPI